MSGIITAIQRVLVSLIGILIVGILLVMGLCLVLISTSFGRMVLFVISIYLLWTHPFSWKAQLLFAIVIGIIILNFVRVLKFQNYIKTYQTWQTMEFKKIKTNPTHEQESAVDAEFKIVNDSTELKNEKE